MDGHYDSSTFHAVMAFQKVTGLQRTGRFTDDVAQALATATDPPSLVPGGGSLHVEIDLPRQVLFLYVDNALFRILPVSTGSGSRYCVDGECARAVTPEHAHRASVEVGSGDVDLSVAGEVSGDDRTRATSRLGRLYNAVYFNGGIAIHGATSVPAYPASHGCVRIPMGAAEWFPSKVSRGTPVYVVGGETAPVPFNEPAPNEAQAVTTTTGPPPPEPVTTTTTAPAPPPTIPIP